MILPTNDNFTNRELSIEELEAIAAGGFWKSIEHVGSALLGYIEGPVGQSLVHAGEALFGGRNVVYAVPHKTR
jgi:hypothetical protein